MIHFFASKNASAEKHKLAMQAWDKLIARQDLGFTQLPLRNENWLSAVLASLLFAIGGISVFTTMVENYVAFAN